MSERGRSSGTLGSVQAAVGGHLLQQASNGTETANKEEMRLSRTFLPEKPPSRAGRSTPPAYLI